MTRATLPTDSTATSPLPVISIIINNSNYRRFLKQSIDSALGQTYPRVEVVVVDDASTDGSQELIRDFGDRVVPVLQAMNGGQAAAMNAGFAASTGDVVIYLDADDYLYPVAAESVANVVRPDAALVQYRLHTVDGDGRVIDLCPPPELRFDTGDVRKKVLETGRFEGTVTSGLAFNRAALSKVLPIPKDIYRISADGYLMTTVPFHGEVLAIERPLGAYRLHGGSLWSATSTGAAGFRRSILHDADKHRALETHASALGFRVPKEMGLRDYQHLSVRLGSLLLEPEKHPIPQDSRLVLGLRGAMAAQRASLPWAHRTLLSIWFGALGGLPRTWSRAVFRWRFDPSSRSPALRSAVRFVRRVMGRRHGVSNRDEGSAATERSSS